MIAILQQAVHEGGRFVMIWFVENPIINERP
jgi:hypothetical protein